MDGVFMKKIICCIGILLLVNLLMVSAGIFRDKAILRDDLIRLHVVANSDSAEDQQLKLTVRDAIVRHLSPGLAEVQNTDQAMAYLAGNLDVLEAVATEVLQEQGSGDSVSIRLQREAFPIRHYDTFSLPSGVYHSLRIEIGQAQGKNWWCVVFPSLCVPETQTGFQDVAVDSGFSDTLGNTLQGEDGYEVRFWVLDLLGRLENILFGG
jgi:stage II sporulation protein R